MARVHIVGAGLSGLSCAVLLARAGTEVALYDSAPQAGGRCRSFHDDSIGRLVDNGSHLLLGANDATRSYMKLIGQDGSALTEIAPAIFPFLDLADGSQWQIRLSSGFIPFWLFSASRRVPNTTPRDYIRDIRALSRAKDDATVANTVAIDGPLFRPLWDPLTRAALNTPPETASATLLWQLLSKTFLRGEKACRPLVFTQGLSPTLIDPALKFLTDANAEIRLKSRLRGLEWNDGRVIGLHFVEGLLRIPFGDVVVLAVPPDGCAELWPDAAPPTSSHAIVNAHFRLPEPVKLPGGGPFIGVLGGETQWLFARDDILSVTVSAGDHLVDRPAWELANMFWEECAKVLGRNVGQTPPWRVIKERRATFAQTPEQLRRRSKSTTALTNLLLAGDWTDTGLPGTIEGSIVSGRNAARAARGSINTLADKQSGQQAAR